MVVNTNFTDMTEFLNHIASSTNMTCLTPIEDICSVSMPALINLVVASLMYFVYF